MNQHIISTNEPVATTTTRSNKRLRGASAERTDGLPPTMIITPTVTQILAIQ
jgi:hypothetical protein